MPLNNTEGTMSHQSTESICVIIEDSDLTDDEPGPTRAVFRPTVCALEAAWFCQPFQRPSDQVISSDIPLECLSKFQDLIWNRPHDRMVHGYGLTPKELASVSSDGRKGWLVTSHFYWLSRCINHQQQHTRFFVLDPAIRKGAVEKLLSGRSVQDIKQLIFVLSVGRQDDGLVFMGTDTMQGDHWSVAVVDVVTGTLTYCDTLGWPAPVNFLPAIIKYTNIFGLSQTSQLSLRMAHQPDLEQHQCTPDCTNYPLQTCSDVCGVIAMVCIATAALDKDLFELLLTPINKNLNLYLTDPTLYSSYLRHVLIYWLITGQIDISRISLKPEFNPFGVKLTPNLNLKRKIENDCNGDSDMNTKRQIKSITHHRNDVTINEYILEAIETGVSSEDLLSEVVNVFSVVNIGQNGSSETLESCVANMTFNNLVERSKDDKLSSKSYCKDLIAFPNCNPVILFKSQGKEFKNLNTEDAILAIQTPFQKEMMKIYGKTCICVDISRKVEGDKFFLITVLVYFEGCIELPVAWLIANRYDNHILNLFFKTIFLNVGPLQTEVFLGDINSKSYKVWIQHFSKPGKKMFNSWEVLQIWNNRVETLIPTLKEQSKIKPLLSLLLTVTDVKAFKGFLQAFLDILKPFNLFLTYFTTKFVEDGKDELWASCYRNIPKSKCTPFLKPHIRILRVAIGGKQKLDRMDIIMHKLLQLNRFLENKFHILPSRLRLERTVREIEKQHDQPLGNLDIFQSASGEEWCIRASAETNAFSIIDSGCTDCECGLICKNCKICVHRYVCSCCDYLVSSSSCKHIHMVNTYKRMNSVINNSNALTFPTRSAEPSTSEGLKTDQDIATLRADAQRALAHLSDRISVIQSAKTLQDISQAIHSCTQN